MSKLFNRVKLLVRKDEEGASLVEYGMLVGLIAVACIAAVTLLGTSIQDGFTAVAGAITGAMTP